MGVEVGPHELAETVARYGFAYLLTVGGGDRAHVVAVTPTVGDGLLAVPRPGRRTTRNLAASPVVTLVWPPADPAGYTLIVDGDGEQRADVVVVRPSRAVLHRAARPAESPGAGCASDCVEIPVPAVPDRRCAQPDR
ncbi:hypothetical protein [Pseudonocardia abyssalis]|uniref:Pyridoxamine 5'-phosphate oxidase putative domain-containing protein n=1 Tax=Pseudonocardia abyssalis TaxID=2792008 RepID=A0ABS6UNJ8_9PSEU|nr:hypothetical protein [Pseudonocardia abyssalis]MBW0118252.1 hypothetical protein [Pseudonocardia abyssalis]MBW0133820.1 hypothetical protein [Pseudonocardia abyssalis]